MQNGLISGLQSLAPIAMSLMLLVALAILWRKDRSVWLIVAIVAELAGLLFRGVMFLAADAVQRTPVFFSLWTLSALVFAAGLLGYALEMNQRR
ncbi:MAG TPA: hypothetical protein VGO25_03635 [Rhodanobacteraceae bacterium]|nr:hypothetical protein [Rhodanobacteraceae bacterium]